MGSPIPSQQATIAHPPQTSKNIIKNIIKKTIEKSFKNTIEKNMSHSQMLGKVESGGGPIFKVVLEC